MQFGNRFSDCDSWHLRMIVGSIRVVGIQSVVLDFVFCVVALCMDVSTLGFSFGK